MFRRSVRAALFIDFDNVNQHTRPQSISNWLQWLEDGEFSDDRRRRRFISKRVYWNSNHEPHRDVFEAAEFDAIICPSRVYRDKSAVDMILALDAMEIASRERSIKEFFILSKDTDFVPLLERLSGQKKSTVILADPSQKFVFSTLTDHADEVISTHLFKTANTYERPKRRLFGWATRKSEPKNSEASPDSVVVAPIKKTPPQPQEKPSIAAALEVVKRLARENADSDISKRTISRALEKTFGKPAVHNWFGRGNYKSFIKHCAASGGLSVRSAAGGGVSVRYKSAMRS